MKKLIICLLFLAPTVISQAQSSGDERTLLGLETQLTEAIAQHNEVFLKNLFDDRYHGVTPAGVEVDKTKWLELLKTNNPYVIFNIEEVKASIFSHTAVVTGKLVGKSKSGSIIGQSRFLHVFIKHSDHWKIIEEQSTLIVQH